MNIRQSRLLKLVLSGVLALSALLGTGSALAYTGLWQSVAIEGQPFPVQKGDFIRYGVTDSPGCSTNACLGLWAYKGVYADGTMYCTNQEWGGDPYPNRAKNCERLVNFGGAANSPPVALRFVAVESSSNVSAAISQRGWTTSTCQMSSIVPCDWVYYIGFQSNGGTGYNFTTLNSSQTCSNASYGDPDWGVQKYCFIPK
ncbi:hypothetical protein ACWKW4_14380 [Hydrogenophaga borbori]|uniref:hypothetical protein n=1 Tax=Hydrogenophaga borbori TaxID=2294117 RepID=UPI00301CE5F3